MIQEKDFLYRVPVKTAPITTPRGQIRNPEILVDVEGGEFMHGNILDANSTNKLVNQSIKEAVDNKIIEGGYVTKDLLEAETTRATEQENSLKTLIGAETGARTKGDEDLSSKIKAEQTRAEGKEKEISDKLAIVDGDSNTEGSFRKAIADVIAAAPEDLDTLKEIADKLAGNDDLHTALNQAITEKADASALANEVSRATGAESGLQAAIATKADATALSNYVLTTALNQQVDTLNTAISAKQDAGSYIPYDQTVTSRYKIDKDLMIDNSKGSAVLGTASISAISNSNTEIQINPSGITMRDDDNVIMLARNGITLPGGDYDHVLTSYGSTINIGEYATQSDLSAQLSPKADRSDLLTLEKKITANTTALNNYALKTELPTVPTKTSQLTNDSNFITAADADSRYALSATADSLIVGLSKKQNKITVNEVDITDIETADITKLRTIVTNLINALSLSGLIIKTSTLE